MRYTLLLLLQTQYRIRFSNKTKWLNFIKQTNTSKCYQLSTKKKTPLLQQWKLLSKYTFSGILNAPFFSHLIGHVDLGAERALKMSWTCPESALNFPRTCPECVLMFRIKGNEKSPFLCLQLMVEGSWPVRLTLYIHQHNIYWNVKWEMSITQ